MSNKLAALGTEVDARQIQFSNGQWKFPAAAGRKGYFVIAAEWCGWCKKLATSMQQARMAYRFPCYFVQGDSGLGQELMRAMGAQGFPSVYTIQADGILTPYQGDRSPRALGEALQQGGGGDFNTSSGWLGSFLGW